MKAKIEPKELLALLRSVSTALPKSPTSPILNCFLLNFADGNTLTATASNLEVTIVKSAPCTVIEPGMVCVEGKSLIHAVDRLKDLIEIEEDAETITFKAGKTKFTFELADYTLYPLVPKKDEGKPDILISEESIGNVFERLRGIVSKDVNRAVLTSICLRVSKEKYTFAATDGRRVGEISLDNAYGSKFTGEILLPSVSFDPVLKNLTKEKDADVSIWANGKTNKILFAVGETLVYSSCFEQKYPDYQKAFVGSESKEFIAFSNSELSDVTKTCLIAAENESLKIKMSIDSEGGAVFTSNKRGEMESSVELQPQESNIQTPNAVSFNGSYLLSILKCIESDSVKITVTSAEMNKSPLLFIGSNTERYLLMPLRS